MFPKKHLSLGAGAVTALLMSIAGCQSSDSDTTPRITSYNVCYTKLLRVTP